MATVMAAAVSSEFVSLCQGQLRSLTQQVADISAAVYIADVSDPLMAQRTAFRNEAAHSQQEPNFVPVVSYPQTLDSWIESFERRPAWARRGLMALPGSVDEEKGEPAIRAPEVAESVADIVSEAPDNSEPPLGEPSTTHKNLNWQDILHPDQQLVVPLVYAEVVVGLLVAIRRDRPWLSEEQHQMEDVAQSLAAGCVLERRNQWLQAQMVNKRALQSRQSEIFHNLLHQFRNPLTAVTTFGQLLVRRLEPEDPNQKVATGIVRESKRLREMVAHFDETVAIGDAELEAETGLPEEADQRLLPGSTSAALSLPAASSAFSSALSSAFAKEDLEPSESIDGRLIDGRLANSELPTAESADTSGLGHALTLSAQYLPDVIEPIVAVAGIVATEKGVTLRAQVAADTPVVWGEEEALCEVVSNLVDNAVKYSPPGAQVWVQTGVSHVESLGENGEKGTVQYQGIVVSDTGPGIPKCDLENLFERNYRGVQAHGTIPGTGLGLAIARSLVQEMQGSIEVISPAVGTPWLPPIQHSASSAVSMASSSATSVSAPSFIGPGSAFIIWLLEVER